ncbi:hypothetical protein [Salinicoccus sp. HZC-1]|uniref:hypothetical protein n=1 Tax=Salinicoccus sp. HZC-1 TaxID=3385497 RepID=UPI00398AA31B
MNKIIAGIIAVLLIAGVVFFVFFNQSSNTGEEVANNTAESDQTAQTDASESASSQEEESSEEETTTEVSSEETGKEPAEEDTSEEQASEEKDESSEESTEESAQETSSEEATVEENMTEESTEETAEEQSVESGNGNTATGSTRNYTASEQCIMSELTECNGVSIDAQFQAYKDLVAEGILPQAPGSGCLACAVKYSFEEKYGESRDIEAQPGKDGTEDSANTGSVESLVSEYLFSLPEYYNGANESTLDYLLPGSNAYQQLTANKASGHFRDHMTYSIYVERVEPLSETEYNAYAYREYSHENSGGVYEAYVRYTVVQQNGRYYISDYTELRNVPVH